MMSKAVMLIHENLLLE